MKLMKKRNLAFLLALAVIIALLPTIASAADPTTSWESIVSGSFAEEPSAYNDGDSYTLSTYSGVYDTKTVVIDKAQTLGTEQNPIGISSEEELILFGKLGTSDTVNKYYILDKPGGYYDMRGSEGYYMLPMFPNATNTDSQMPSPANSFKGTLIGNGAAITNANIGDYSDKTSYILGLFSAIEDGNVCDLYLRDIHLYVDPEVTIVATFSGTGALAGHVSASNILGCQIEGVTYGNTECSSDMAGGLLGITDGNTRVIHCYVEANSTLKVRTGSSIGGRGSIGGLVGYVENGALIENCTVKWDISTEQAYYFGGIAGYNRGTINKSNHIGTVSCNYASASAVGGIAGYNRGTILNSYQEGNISADNGDRGGIAGDNYGTIHNSYQNGSVSGGSYVGGITGFNSSDGDITNSYHTGGIAGSSPLGGIAGYSYGSMSFSYCDSTALAGVYGDQSTTTGCGTFESNISPVTLVDNNVNGVAQTGTKTEIYATSGTTKLLDALNNWVDGDSSGNYSSWTVQSGVNGGFPILVDVGTEKVIINRPVSPGASSTVLLGKTPVAYTLSSGTALVSPSKAEVEKAKGEAESGVLTLHSSVITGCTSVKLSLDPAWLSGSGVSLKIGLPSGGEMLIPRGLWAGLSSLSGGESLSFELSDVSGGGVSVGVSKNGSALNWYDGKNAMCAALSYTPPQDISTDRIVMADAKGAVIARSWYSDGKVYAKVAESGKYSAMVGSGGQFSDTVSLWMEQPVDYMAIRGIIKGVGDGKFDPHRGVTRAEFVTMLMRIIQPDLTNPAAAPFADTGDIPSWAQDYVAATAAMGIVKGGTDNRFYPNAMITREDMFVITARAMEAMDMIPDAMTAQWIIYSDWDDVSGYAANDIQTLSKLGLVQGWDGNVSPKQSASRAEAAQFLFNLLEYDMSI